MLAALTLPFRAVRRFLAHHGFVLAGALSYSLLVCLAPLVLLLFSATGFVLTSDQFTEYILDVATRLFPGSGEDVRDLLALLTRERRVTGLLGAAGLLLGSTQLFSLARTVTNTAFEAPAGGSAVRGFALDVLLVGVLGLVGVAVAIALVLVVTLADLIHQMLPGLPISGWIRLAGAGLLYAALLLLLYLVYRVSPSVRVPAASAAVATLAVAALWELARWLLTTYVALFARYGRLYGSLGVAVAALVWIYYSAALFVLGAEVAAVMTSDLSSRRRRGSPGAMAPAGHG
jgi:membrane protein